YNALFYLPLIAGSEIAGSEGSKRDPDPQFQREIDDEITRFFQDNPSLPLVRLPPQRETWTRRITNHILGDLGLLDE
ncbi:MAG: hypothetical protein AABX37_00875, partial [Nanoarchaeota archaeon]